MHRLVTVGRVHLVASFAVSAGEIAGTDGLAERAVESRRVFRRVGHDLHILVAGIVKRFADRGDTAIHHV